VSELQKLQKEINGIQARVPSRATELPKPAEVSKPKAELKPEPKPEPKPPVAEVKPASPQVPANRDRVLMYPRPNTAD
jgi:hypothetical protein